MTQSSSDAGFEQCIKGQAPPCSAVCPFGMDVRQFAERLSRGSIRSAYKTYRDAVVFPQIVSRLCPAPCMGTCLRRELDDAVVLPELERACVANSGSTEPLNFNLPKKEQRIAVIGAGVAGLTLAQRLSSKKYSVTIYEAENTVGGKLSEHLDYSIYLPEIEMVFKKADCCEFIFNTRVSSLDELDYNAIFISPSSGIDDQGENIFSCERNLNPVYKIKAGMEAFNEIEWYLKTGSKRTKTEASPRPAMVLNLENCEKKLAVPKRNGGYDKSEAAEEAARCLRCDCNACIDACHLLQKHNISPSRLKEDVEASMNPVSLFTHRVASRLINTCNQCGLCTAVCPSGVDICGFLTESRKQLNRLGSLPPAFHDFWLRDMEYSASVDASCDVIPETGTVEYLFFPGCQLGASSPQHVIDSYDYILKHYTATAITMDCCGAPAIWAGDEALHKAQLEKVREKWQNLGRPTVITACPSCMRQFAEYIPEISVISLYEMMCSKGIGEKPATDESVYVFHPCSSRGFPELQKQVQELASLAGYAHQEKMDQEGKKASCCGWGGHIYPADKEYTQSVTSKRTEISASRYITYCVNCRDVFKDQEKGCLHVLDVVFGNNEGDSKPPTVTMRRANRRKLKSELSRRYCGMTEAAPESMPNKLIISAELSEQMSKDLILESDVNEVIEYCERTGSKLAEKEEGSFIGCLKLGVITCWVVYKPVNDGYELLRVYSHRMSIDD